MIDSTVLSGAQPMSRSSKRPRRREAKSLTVMSIDAQICKWLTLQPNINHFPLGIRIILIYASQLFFLSPFPRLIRVVLCHGLYYLVRVFSEILLIHHTIVVDDECHNP